MNQKATRCCLLAALCCASSASNAAPRQPKRPAEVLVMYGNLFGVGSPAPLRQLCLTLTKHPQSRLFRVKWDSNASNGSSLGTALYDRHHKTLKLVSYDSWDVDMKEANVAEVKEMLDEWLFADVSDAKLRRLPQKYSHDFGSEDASQGYFPHLRELGCKQRLLRHVAQSHREKI